MTGDSPRLRLSILGVVVVSLFAALFARLWYLQVMTSDEFQVAAEVNIVREIPTQAPRGRILDRNGKVVVDNRIAIQVTVDRPQFMELDADRRREVLERLAFELSRASVPTTAEELEQRVADQRFSQYVPVPVVSGISEDLKIWLDEHADELPSVTAERVAVRTYPYGSLAAHVLGYVGKINDEEFQDRRGADKPYTLNDDIGKSGVERVYEDHLRGQPGLRRIEVDAFGAPIRLLDEVEPIPGDDLVLSIDIDVQGVAEQALSEALERARGRTRGATAPAGSLVVSDVQDGSIRAMASYPTFWPGDFTDGISSSEWAILNDPANHYPLNNWAIQGQYPPGSIFKVFTGYAALAQGLLTESTPYVDTGGYTVQNCRGPGCTVRNAGGVSHGTIDFRPAMTVSSNAYFADIGAQFWIQRGRFDSEQALQDGFAPFRFGERHGIDLPSEQPGRIPSPQWKREFCERVTCEDDGWYTGDNINMSIGQGDVLLTPLQMANGYGALGNGGTLHQPSVARAILSGVTGEEIHRFEPEVAGEVPMPPEIREPMIDGLVGVTSAERGTARGSFVGFPNDTWPVAGKTGTAQVFGKADTAVFAAFGPAYAPQYSVAVVMEESGFGGANAAPVARRLFDVLSGTVPLPDALTGEVPGADPDADPDPALTDPLVSGGRVLD
jgi:penicillin-binding protein 2